MKVKLNVLERITLLGILPAEGNYLTFKILMDLKALLSFTEEEIKRYGITEADGLIHWQMSSDAELNIGEKAMDIIMQSLKKLDEQGKLNDRTFPLYERLYLSKQS
jgi:hypothetical protein